MHKTDGELNYLARRYGWEKKKLTRAAINRMTADESDWQSRFNGEEFVRAWNEDAVKAENQKNAETAKTQRMWADQATKEETDEAVSEVAVFCKAFPQFRGDSVPNREALVAWLKERSLQITARNLAEAFQALGVQGELVLNPSAIGIGAETEITGARLTRHPQLWKLLEPPRAQTDEDKTQVEIDKLSAKEWRELNPEAFRQETPALVKQKFLQATNTFLSFHPEYVPSAEHRKHLRAYLDNRKLAYNHQNLELAYADLVAEGYIEPNPEAVVSNSGTKLVDFGSSQPRTRTLPADVQRQIRKMSSSQYQEWLQIPANRALVNA